jgi:protein-tyrosine phosphatase
MTILRFGPAGAGEGLVFGAARTGYPAERLGRTTVDEWLQAVRVERIQAVVCLLDHRQLEYYGRRPGLLALYRDTFGVANVLHAPVPDYHLCAAGTLRGLLRFVDAIGSEQRVLLHCSGGLGRTGHVLAAWLVYGRGLGVDEAIKAVVKTGRRPTGAVAAGSARKEDLHDLLRQCRAWRDGQGAGCHESP